MSSNKKGKKKKQKSSSPLKKNEYANPKLEDHQSMTHQHTIEETGTGLLFSIAKRRNGIDRYEKSAVPLSTMPSAKKGTKKNKSSSSMGKNDYADTIKATSPHSFERPPRTKRKTASAEPIPEKIPARKGSPTAKPSEPALLLDTDIGQSHRDTSIASGLFVDTDVNKGIPSPIKPIHLEQTQP